MPEKETNTSIRQELTLALRMRDIILPEIPQKTEKPGKWLIRGDSDQSKLYRGEIQPTSGEMATYGVFLGDCFSSLMYPTQGPIYYVFNSEIFKQAIIIGSDTYQTELNSIAFNRQLDFKRIRDAAEAEGVLYQTLNTYNRTTGVFTVSSTVRISDAETILIHPSIHSTIDWNRIDKDIRSKISELPKLASFR